MRAIGYFRESPLGGDVSLAQQNKAFLEFCEREGYEVAGSFVDAASSNSHAPGFRQLVEFLRARDRGFVVVVVPSIEALGGDLRDAARRYFQIEGLGAQIAPMTGTSDPSADRTQRSATAGGAPWHSCATPRATSSTRRECPA